jgi:uncharacterized RDD family membrane protein YckC
LELPAASTFCPNCGTPVPTAAQTTAVPTATGPATSGLDTLTKDKGAQDYWVKRFIAFIVDAIIVYIPLFIITFAVAFFLIAVGGAFGFYGLLFGTFSFVWGFLFVLYFTVTESMWGASFGKRFFKLKVVNKAGKNPEIGESFIRNLSKINSLLLLLDVIVGLALSKGVQQKWTDQFTGNKVVLGQ